MNISFFSGKCFMHYLEIYNNYIETLENNPNLFFEKIIKEFKDDNTCESLESYLYQKLEMIEEDFNLNSKEEINMEKEYKNKLIKSFQQISEENQVEINTEKINEIIFKLYCVKQEFKNMDFSNTIYSSEFFDKLKIVIMNAIPQQKQQSKLMLLHSLSLLDKFMTNSANLSSKKYESSKNKLIEQINEYFK